MGWRAVGQGDTVNRVRVRVGHGLWGQGPNSRGKPTWLEGKECRQGAPTWVAVMFGE